MTFNQQLEITLIDKAAIGALLLIAGYWLNRVLERFKSDLRRVEDESKVAAQQRVELRKAVKKYSGVVLLAASDLQDRLWHLCERQSQSKNPVLLAQDDNAPIYVSWPMTRRHYLMSTLYLFARYFCWVEILRSRIQYLDYGDDEKTNTFNYHMKRVERSLAETDLQKLATSTISTDRPLFQLMQTDAGESLLD